MDLRPISATLAFLILAVPLPGWGQQKKTRPASDSILLNPRKCQPATPEQQKWVGPGWAKFEEHEIVCPLRTHSGALVLYVLSVNGYDVAKEVVPGAEQPKLPKALIVKPPGQIVGELPLAFPFDAPATLDVTFAHWRHGFPQKVEMRIEDPSLAGNKTLAPLKWDGQQGRFAQTEDANGK